MGGESSAFSKHATFPNDADFVGGLPLFPRVMIAAAMKGGGNTDDDAHSRGQHRRSR
jgi:hypothetical protein